MMILERLTPKEAVIYDGDKRLTVSRELVPESREGDVLILQNGAYLTDKAATEKRRHDITALQNSLWE